MVYIVLLLAAQLQELKSVAAHLLRHAIWMHAMMQASILHISLVSNSGTFSQECMNHEGHALNFGSCCAAHAARFPQTLDVDKNRFPHRENKP